MAVSLDQFSQNLLDRIDNAPTVKNVKTILSGILHNGTCQLYTISNDKNEYNKLQRTVTQANSMSTINPKMVNDTLMDDFTSKISEAKEIFVIHDPSDIRKPYSFQTENLGKVLDLNGKVVNGFNSYNIVATCDKNKAVNLLSHISFSNNDPKFLKVEDIKKLKERKSFEGEEAARQLLDSEEYFNKKTIANEELIRISADIKSKQSHLKLTHILDREFDDKEIYDLVNNHIHDDFVIRAKKSRVIDAKDDNGKKIKLIESDFENSNTRRTEVVKLKKKVYQNATIIISWGGFNDYNAVRITIKDCKGKQIFKDPMLLITNKSIESADDAYNIYLIYFKRSKIEHVFRFLKDGLGWENIQLRDFVGVQNLLSLCFYLASYLYGIGDEVASDDFAIVLAELGGGKGKVTRHYILKGIKMLIAKYKVDQIFTKRNVTKLQEEEMRQISGVDLVIG